MNNDKNIQLAGQLIFPRLDVDEYFENKLHYQKLAEICGGFCLFGGNKESARQAIAELQIRSETLLLFCADFENGLQMRLDDGTSFPHAMAMGRSKYTAEIATAIAKEMKDIGVYWNLAPVCDINNNKHNPVIDIRAFGEEASVVSDCVSQYITAMQAENVLCCAKHFPGHGDTDTDSHTDLPFIDKSKTELEQNELLPFQKAISLGVKSIMVGHIVIPSLASLPCSLSHNVITNLLRLELGYDGIIVSDALDMKSLHKFYNEEEIIQRAFMAGNDVLLMPKNPILAINTLAELLKDEELRLKAEYSLKKIIKAKRFAEIIPRKPKINTQINAFSSHLKLALDAAIEAKCVNIENSNITDIIPLNEDTNFATFAIIQQDTDIKSASRFFTMLAQATENDCNMAYLDQNITEDELMAMKNGIKDAQVIIFLLLFKGRGYAETRPSPAKINEIIEKLAESRPVIVILAGSPYLAENIASNNTILLYSDSAASLAAAVMDIAGRNRLH